MATNKQEAEEKRSKFYEKLTAGMNCEISETLKNILRYQHMDQPQMLLKFDQDYTSIEVFVRGEAYKSLMNDPNDEEELEKFYGVYAKTPNDFTFSQGLKIQLESMITYIKNHPRQFKTMKSKSQGTSPNDSLNDSFNDSLNDPHQISPQIQAVEESKLLERLHDSKSKMDSALKEKLKEVSVTEVFQSENGIQAKLACPLCNIHLIVSKARSKNCKNWSLSNLYKHLKKCGSKKRKRNSAEENEEIDEEIDVENDSSTEIASEFSDNQSTNFSRLPLREINYNLDYNSVNINNQVNNSQNLPAQQYESELNCHNGYIQYGFDSRTSSKLHNDFINKDYNPQSHHSTDEDMLPTPTYGCVTEIPVNINNENEGFYSAMQTIQYQSEYQNL